jgi:hypothetical protein
MQATFIGPNDPFHHLGTVRRTSVVELLIHQTVSSSRVPRRGLAGSPTVLQRPCCLLRAGGSHLIASRLFRPQE